MARLSILLAAMFWISCASAQTEDRTSSEQTIKVNVNLVVIDAQVLTRKTHQPVRALTLHDFLLFENGMRQEISALSQDKLPLSVVFLFDLTDSVRPMLESLAGGALQALQHLKPEDKAAVMVYSASVKLLQDFTTDRDLVVKAIRKASRMESSEAAFFNEALFQAARQAARSDRDDRRVILWLTDNVPNIPSEEIKAKYGRSVPDAGVHTESEAVAQLLKTGTSVFTLLQQSEISEMESARNSHDPLFIISRFQYPPGDVYKYTRQTGGEVVESYRSRKVAAKMAELIDQIRDRYALAYHPVADGQNGKFREIHLEISPDVVTREGQLIVETKQGYYR